jgi:hypothetical protein
MVMDARRNAIVDGVRFDVFEDEFPCVLERLPALDAV